MAILKPRTDRLAEIADGHSVSLFVGVHIAKDDRPEIGWDGDVVEWLAMIGASIDVDLYELEGAVGDDEDRTEHG